MVNKHHGVELFLKSHKKLNPGLQFLGRGFQYFTSSNRIATGVVQMNPGSHKFKYRSVEYSALYSSLHSLSHDTVFFPYRVCCGADGGEWDVVLDIIKSRVHNPVFVRPKRG